MNAPCKRQAAFGHWTKSQSCRIDAAPEKSSGIKFPGFYYTGVVASDQASGVRNNHTGVAPLRMSGIIRTTRHRDTIEDRDASQRLERQNVLFRTSAYTPIGDPHWFLKPLSGRILDMTNRP